MSRVSTYNILSFCINCNFCFLIFSIFFSISSFKSHIRRKSQSIPKSLKKNTLSELGVEISTFVPCERRWSWYRMTHCKVKGTGRGIVWHIAMWNTLVVLPYGALYRMAPFHIALVVLPYDTLPGERHWSWYCMTHCHVKGTSHGTVWHLAKWEAVVVVPYNTLLGEKHWSWYRKTHCQMKGTGQGSAWHIVMWNTRVVVPQDTLTDERHWSW